MELTMDRFKYPRTYHLPYSPSVSDDDKMLPDDSQFIGREVSVSIKMDGENTTVYPDGTCHARSLDGWGRKWQSWMTQYARTWCNDIPDGWRVCGEDLYARHSISYSFPDRSWFFQVFGIYNERNECLSIDEELEWCRLLGLRHVPVFYRGMYDRDAMLDAFGRWKDSELDINGNETEGFVVRIADSFPYADFSRNTGKYVRPHHVQTDSHWTSNWKPNMIKP